MEELRREALAQAIVWLPTLAAALSLFILFLVLSRVAHFGVLRVVERTRAYSARWGSRSRTRSPTCSPVC